MLSEADCKNVCCYAFERIGLGYDFKERHRPDALSISMAGDAALGAAERSRSAPAMPAASSVLR